MARVIVTGAQGFIGRALVAELLKRGDVVLPMGRIYTPVQCDIIYHLACPSTTEFINANPNKVMDIIMDGTRQALDICPTAVFVNASSMGAASVDDSCQGAYNVAKLCMENYLLHLDRVIHNYRLPSVYGPGMHNDAFIKRCVDGTAYIPTDPNKTHYIAHIDDVVHAFVNLSELAVEKITLGQIYESFNSGRRGLYRSSSDPLAV
jgi:nucleoside-diphosphate-sugar epimerase